MNTLNANQAAGGRQLKSELAGYERVTQAIQEILRTA